jgi:hypothetical protein
MFTQKVPPMPKYPTPLEVREALPWTEDPDKTKLVSLLARCAERFRLPVTPEQEIEIQQISEEIHRILDVQKTIKRSTQLS